MQEMGRRGPEKGYSPWMVVLRDTVVSCAAVLAVYTASMSNMVNTLLADLNVCDIHGS
jgi:hypothetical protein